MLDITFLFIAQSTQFVVCCLFSLWDLNTQRILLREMIPGFCYSLLGFLPFLFIPLHFQNGGTFDPIQFVACLLCSDLLHYLTHRLLHHNPWLRTNVHNIHHNYQGDLYCWVGAHAHPIEVLMNNIAIFAPFQLANPIVLWVFTVLVTINSVVIHSGYQLYHLPFGLTSTHHQKHHDKVIVNYGNVFIFWDWIFNTLL